MSPMTLPYFCSSMANMFSRVKVSGFISKLVPVRSISSLQCLKEPHTHTHTHTTCYQRCKIVFIIIIKKCFIQKCFKTFQIFFLYYTHVVKGEEERQQRTLGVQLF